MEDGLPKNWVETDIKTISKIYRGISYNKSQSTSEFSDDSIYVLRGGNIQDGKVNFDTDDNVYVNKSLVNEVQLIKTHDVIIVGSTGSKTLIGKAGIADKDFNKVGFGAFLLLLRTRVIEPKFHSYFFLTKYYRDTIRDLAGGVNINNIRKEYLENLVFPLPPLAEQKRIVAKLDKLFAQIEVMKRALERIPQLLKDFRQQVLTQAVTGKLTEKTRKTASISYVPTVTIDINADNKPKGWSWNKLVGLSKLESGHTPRKSKEEYWSKGEVLWISLQDIRKANGKIITDTLFKPNKLGIKNSSARLLPAGTVCFCRDISVGYVTIMGHSMATSQHFANWICGDLLSNKFLMYSFLASRPSLIASGAGTTVKTIYMPALKELKILTPPIKEQLEIVNIIESLFSKADVIEAKYKILKQKIENLPQAILHKAFKGELVEKLHTDGDAKDLLEEIKKLNFKK